MFFSEGNTAFMKAFVTVVSIYMKLKERKTKEFNKGVKDLQILRFDLSHI
jgi:hypothetical protein